MGIQSFGFLLGVIGVSCGFLLENRSDADVSTHKGLGIFIFVLGCLQVTKDFVLEETPPVYKLQKVN